MNFRWLTLFLHFFCITALCSVKLDTSINDLYYRGASALAGCITMEVTGDDFRDASEANPIFIRIVPDHNSFLAETRVEQASLDPLISSPINLAMKLDGGFTLIAEPDAVSIVRWVAGESQIWIRVKQSSDLWLMGLSGPVGPSSTQEVSWNLGVPARLSDGRNEMSSFGSNLPFNTRDITAVEGDFALATSSHICLDLTTSNLQVGSWLQIDIIAFDKFADLGGGVYSGQAGNDTGINFTNDFVLARGKEQRCYPGSIIQGSSSHHDGSGGLAAFTKQLTLRVDCGGRNQLGGYFHPGSSLTVSSTLANVGIEAGGARFTVEGEPAGTVLGNPESVISVNGVMLYREVDLIWDGTARWLFLETISFEVTQQFRPQSQLELGLIVQTTIQTSLEANDEAPYDGQDQNRRCQPRFLTLEAQEISLAGALVSPYLPEWPQPLDVRHLVVLSLPAPVLQTGQTETHGPGDDGAQQTGLALSTPRYIDNGDGTVTDPLTGLIWMSDTTCAGNLDWSSAVAYCNSLAAGSCSLQDDSEAGDWRLPTVREMRSLINLGYNGPALSNAAGNGQWTAGDPFLTVAAETYWTSTTTPQASSEAYSLSLMDGAGPIISKSSPLAIWPVRNSGQPWACASVAETGQTLAYASGDDGTLRSGVSLPLPRFSEMGNGTVLDRLSGLLWLRTAACAGAMIWQDALAFVNELASPSCGLSDGSVAGDWRLPSLNELLSLANYNETPVLSDTSGQGVWSEGEPFYGLSTTTPYWTSTSRPGTSNARWEISWQGGLVAATDQSATRYVWAVRTMAHPLAEATECVNTGTVR